LFLLRLQAAVGVFPSASPTAGCTLGVIMCAHLRPTVRNRSPHPVVQFVVSSTFPDWRCPQPATTPFSYINTTPYPPAVFHLDSPPIPPVCVNRAFFAQRAVQLIALPYHLHQLWTPTSVFCSSARTLQTLIKIRMLAALAIPTVPLRRFSQPFLSLFSSLRRSLWSLSFCVAQIAGSTLHEHM
jgi:hypothetical protein